MLQGAKVLVAGGAGFLGTNLIFRLMGKGCRIRATVHQAQPGIKSDQVEYVSADLTRPEDCRRSVEGVDYVFMCAANTSGAAVMTQTPLVHVTPNVVMNAQMLEAAYQAKVKKFLFISSGAAYPPTGDRPVREEEMFDGDPAEVYYSVAWMKRYAEILCKIYAQKITPPMPTVVVRPSNIYGPYDKFDPQRSHVTAALIRKVADRQNPLEVWGTGDDARDLIYVDDFMEGLLKAFESSDPHLVVNVASGQTHTVKQILQTLLEIENFTDAKISFNASKPRTIAARPIDVAFAQKHLEFRASTSLRDGLQKTIQWYREHSHAWAR